MPTHLRSSPGAWGQGPATPHSLAAGPAWSSMTPPSSGSSCWETKWNIGQDSNSGFRHLPTVHTRLLSWVHHGPLTLLFAPPSVSPGQVLTPALSVILNASPTALPFQSLLMFS